MKLPPFFKDLSESMKFEEVIDFFISWTIRCADNIYKEDNELLNFYSKRILSKLFYGDEYQLEKETVHEIKVWKQSNNVDLWIEFKIKGIDNLNVLIIENKMYSSIRTGQLEKYKSIVTSYYTNEPNCDIRFVFLRPDYEINKQLGEDVFCVEQGYSYLNLEQLQDLLVLGSTGNDLFDEFWFKWKSN